MSETLTADEVIALFGLKPHPEGGHYRETFRDALGHADRAHSTAILFLLKDGEVARWHKVDAAEHWHSRRGAAAAQDQAATRGARFRRAPAIVPAHAGQSARSLGAWTLVGCSMAPGFDFSGFEMAPENWER